MRINNHELIRRVKDGELQYDFIAVLGFIHERIRVNGRLLDSPREHVAAESKREDAHAVDARLKHLRRVGHDIQTRPGPVRPLT